MRRLGLAVGTALLSAGVLGLIAYGSSASPDGPGVSGALDPEGEALAAMGFEVPGQAVDDPSPGVAPGDGDQARERGEGWQPGERWRKRHPGRVFLHKNVLHGEVTVQTKDGTRTLVVQRGTVTAIDDTSVTVESTDGFTLTWTFGDTLRVFERRSTIQPENVDVGAEIGVAGAKDGDENVARLIVVPNRMP